MRLFLILAAFALPAAADDERFEKLDFDRDGRVSLAEAAGNADLIKGFDRADRNRDGKLTRREYDALLARAEKMEAQRVAKEEAAAAKAQAAAAKAEAAAAKSAATGGTSPKGKAK